MDRFRTRFPATIVLAVGFLLLGLGSALAHADFVGSTPEDGAELTEPVEQIELAFTAAISPIPGGIQVLGEVSPVVITVFQPSDDKIVVQPAEPLTDGRYVVLWRAESADAHQIEGTITVTVAAETPTSAAGDDEPAAGAESAVEATSDAEETTEPPPTTAARVTTTSLPMVSERLPERALKPQDIEVVRPENSVGTWIARIGRWALMLGGLLAIGAFVFAGTALVGSAGEVRGAIRWMRRGGVLVLVGAIAEVWGTAVARSGSFGDALTRSTLVDLLAGSIGIALLLRLAGGVALLQDPRFAATRSIMPTADNAGPGTTEASLEPTDAVAVATAPPGQRFRLRMSQEWVAAAGVLAVAASFMFDGHSVSVDQSVVARIGSLVHVLAAGVWFGGLVVMAATLAKRRQDDLPLEAAPMAIRFSRAATLALVGAALAGIALAWTIVESAADLVSSTWGRLLLAKVAMVAIVATLGIYNHFKVVPALDESPAAEATSDRLRQLVRIEAGVLVVVLAVTAALVGTSP
ncbi:MAG: CopD family protein [Acidimicrobiia bacterium]|nr:CopD family protein [Acidimicrobiia bacterium]